MKIFVNPTALFMLLGAVLGYGMISTTAYARDGDRDAGRYYPTYHERRHHRHGSYNPTVRRDYYESERRSPDGTYHSENVEERRHASYYSAGRNQAITRPRTTTQSWSSPDQEATREKTTWIGADHRPHSTTIDKITTTDMSGNTHTDTQVTLKSARRPK